MGESDLPASSGLGIRALESNFQSFLEAGITESTMKVYRAGWSRYQTFANQFEIASTPVTPEKVTLFVAYLGSKGWQFRQSRSTWWASGIFESRQTPHAWLHCSTPRTSTLSSKALNGSTQQNSPHKSSYPSLKH